MKFTAIRIAIWSAVVVAAFGLSVMKNNAWSLAQQVTVRAAGLEDLSRHVTRLVGSEVVLDRCPGIYAVTRPGEVAWNLDRLLMDSCTLFAQRIRGNGNATLFAVDDDEGKAVIAFTEWRNSELTEAYVYNPATMWRRSMFSVMGYGASSLNYPARGIQFAAKNSWMLEMAFLDNKMPLRSKSEMWKLGLFVQSRIEQMLIRIQQCLLWISCSLQVLALGFLVYYGVRVQELRKRMLWHLQDAQGDASMFAHDLRFGVLCKNPDRTETEIRTYLLELEERRRSTALRAARERESRNARELLETRRREDEARRRLMLERDMSDDLWMIALGSVGVFLPAAIWQQVWAVCSTVLRHDLDPFERLRSLEWVRSQVRARPEQRDRIRVLDAQAAEVMRIKGPNACHIGGYKALVDDARLAFDEAEPVDIVNVRLHDAGRFFADYDLLGSERKLFK